MHDALEAEPADVAYCGWQAIGAPPPTSSPNIPPDFDAGEAPPAIFCEQCPWPINSVLIRRPLIDELRGFSERAPTAMDDDLWLRMLARQPRLVRVPDVLAFHRHHLPRAGAHIPRWRQVFDAVAVRRDFVRHHPELVAGITACPPQRTDLRPAAARSLSLPLAQRHRFRPPPVPPRLRQGRLESGRSQAPPRQPAARPALSQPGRFRHTPPQCAHRGLSCYHSRQRRRPNRQGDDGGGPASGRMRHPTKREQSQRLPLLPPLTSLKTPKTLAYPLLPSPTHTISAHEYHYLHRREIFHSYPGCRGSKAYRAAKGQVPAPSVL